MRLSSWVGLISVLLIVSLLGSLDLTTYAIWYDEAFYHVIFGGAFLGPARSPVQILSLTAQAAAWPPLSNLTFAGWGALVDYSADAMRVLPWLFGVLSLAVMYRLASDLFSARAGMISVLLMGTSAFYLHYLHEMRAYTLYALMTTLTILLYWRLLTTTRVPRWLPVAFTGSFLLLLSVHYIGAGVAGALGLYHLIWGRRSQRWGQVLFQMVLGGVLFSPWLVITVAVVAKESAGARSMSLGEIVYALLYGFGNGLFVLLPLWLIYTLWKVRGRAVHFLWVLAVVFVIAASIFNLVADYLLHIRHWMGLFPILILLASAGLAHLGTRRPRLAATLVGIWVIWGAGNTVIRGEAFMRVLPGQVDRIQQGAIEEIVSAAETCFSPGDAVLFHLGTDEREWLNDYTLQYYLPGAAFTYSYPEMLTDVPSRYDELGWLRTEAYDVDLSDPYEVRLARFVDDAEAVWLVSLRDLPEAARMADLNALLPTQFPEQVDFVGDWISVTGYANGERTCGPETVLRPYMPS